MLVVGLDDVNEFRVKVGIYCMVSIKFKAGSAFATPRLEQRPSVTSISGGVKSCIF